MFKFSHLNSPRIANSPQPIKKSSGFCLELFFYCGEGMDLKKIYWLLNSWYKKASLDLTYRYGYIKLKGGRHEY